MVRTTIPYSSFSNFWRISPGGFFGINGARCFGVNGRGAHPTIPYSPFSNFWRICAGGIFSIEIKASITDFTTGAATKPPVP